MIKKNQPNLFLAISLACDYPILLKYLARLTCVESQKDFEDAVKECTPPNIPTGDGITLFDLPYELIVCIMLQLPSFGDCQVFARSIGFVLWPNMIEYYPQFWNHNECHYSHVLNQLWNFGIFDKEVENDRKVYEDMILDLSNLDYIGVCSELDTWVDHMLYRTPRSLGHFMIDIYPRLLDDGLIYHWSPLHELFFDDAGDYFTILLECFDETKDIAKEAWEHIVHLNIELVEDYMYGKIGTWTQYQLDLMMDSGFLGMLPQEEN